ncbi:Nn.00g067070.m01.CDS01 [Neocucurbitaria sp. VM-36]
MVNIALIRESNKHIDESSAPRVAVFVGGTAGIGKITLTEIAGLGTSFKAYVIVRKESADSIKPFFEQLHQANPNANVIMIEGEISLLSEVKRVCDYIKPLETQIDLLFMTTGYAPFGGRQNTSEGLDTSHSLSFYARIYFAENLLPLLRASGRARVISVLFGGMESEKRLDINDLNLEQPGAFGGIATQIHMGIMGTLALERLAEERENQSIVFIHSHPGIVRTGNLFRGWEEGSWGPWLSAVFFDPILMLFAFSFKESAERYLYQVTSGTFGGKGPTLPGIVGRTTRGELTGGLFLVSKNCDTVMNEKELAKLRVTAREVVWTKAQDIIGPYI